MSSFVSLGVPARLSDILAGLDITTPTPIQSATLPDALAGRDVLGRGRTGSGKTLAFVLPIVTRLAAGKRASSGAPRALILAPTRELAGQIEATLKPLADAAGLSTHAIFGGVGQNPQVTALRRGVDVLVACPGRLEDLINQRHCSLAKVEITVLDEADHMADLGFLPGVRRLLRQTPATGQRLLFSATLDNAVDKLVREFLTTPAVHEADSAQSPVGTMTHHVLQVERDHRLPVLVDLSSAPGRTVVFTRTKHGAKALAKQLTRSGVPAVELHGNLSQNARTRNLEDFHAGRATALVATDIAARGIHVDDVTLVIHADPPTEHKAYLHRSGRTARAGADGTVVTLMTAEQKREVAQLTKAAGIRPTVTQLASADHPVLTQIAPGERTFVEPSPAAPASAQSSSAPRDSVGGGRRRGRRGNGPGASSQGGARQGGSRQGGPRQGGNAGSSSRSGSERHESSSARAGAPRASAARSGGRRSGGAPSAGASGRRHSAADFSSGRR